jgi:hypothetical protein
MGRPDWRKLIGPFGLTAVLNVFAYLESSRSPADAYETLDRLAARYANRPYAGSDGSTLGTMKCIDFFDSAELNRLAAAFAQRGEKLKNSRSR